MPPVLDPAAMLEYIEKVRTPKKGQTSKNYSKHGSEAESAEASTENKAKDSTPTPSPKKSKASVLPFNLNLASPAAQFGLTSEPPPSPTQSSTGATVGDSPSSRGNFVRYVPLNKSDKCRRSPW